MKPRAFSARRGQLQATLTGQHAGPGPIEAHERNVLAITRAIHSLNAKQRALKKQLAEVRAALKIRKRELRLVLQRDSSIVEDDRRLELAGQSDAIDASEHARERKGGGQ